MRNKLLADSGKLILTAGAFCATQYLCGTFAKDILGAVLGNVASSQVENFEYQKIKNLINTPNPRDLNHDLNKLLWKASRWAMKNITILYSENLSDKNQKRQAKTSLEKLINELNSNYTYLNLQDDDIINLVDSNPNIENILTQFNIAVERLPIVNQNKPLPNYFKENYIPNVQLCFGELLKKEENRPAWIAYQRFVSNSIKKTIKEQPKIADSALVTTKLLEGLENLSLEDSGKILLNTIAKQNKIIQDKITLVTSEVILTREVSQRTERKVDDIHNKLDQRWIEKNKVFVSSVFIFSLIVLAGTGYYLYRQPFDFNISLATDNSLNIHKDYPTLDYPTIITLNIDNNKKSEEISTKNTVVFQNISSEYKNRMVAVELNSKYWKTVKDSIKLTTKGVQVEIMPNERLSTVTGNIKLSDGLFILNNAKIQIDNKHTFSPDENGNFSYEIPLSDRKKSYKLSVKLEGFKEVVENYYPGSGGIEILLNKNE